MTIWLRHLDPFLGGRVNKIPSFSIRYEVQEFECQTSYLRDSSKAVSETHDENTSKIPGKTLIKEVIAIVEETSVSIIRFLVSKEEDEIVQKDVYLYEVLITPPEPPPKA